MNRIVLICFLFIVSLTACKKDKYRGLDNTGPDVPITVSDLYGIFTYPVVATSLSGSGAITIKLNIPASTGRTIKEITRVALGTSGANYAVVQRTTGLYNTAPIPGSGTSVTFTTSLTEYTAKTGLTVTTGGTATSFLARYFYFLVTLDNGEQVISEAVRVYVNA
ncbi:MAG: hypothetical protein ABI480_04670 [Chitinophagaceae bacterium]